LSQFVALALGTQTMNRAPRQKAVADEFKTCIRLSSSDRSGGNPPPHGERGGIFRAKSHAVETRRLVPLRQGVTSTWLQGATVKTSCPAAREAAAA
jgi:hypothetical protein